MSQNHIQYSIVTCSSQYHIDQSFIHELFDRGLLELQKEKEEYFIVEDQLSQLERFVRLHEDFELNVAGIEVVEELLSKIENLQVQMRNLQSKVSLLRDFE